MKLTKPVAPLILIIPAIVYLPVIVEISKGFHFGGLNIILSFIASAINPSFDYLVLKSAWNGLQITIAIALFIDLFFLPTLLMAIDKVKFKQNNKLKVNT